MNRKLVRSRRDSMLAGVCGGIGKWLNVDSTIIRVLFVLGVFFSGFSLLIPYFIIALVIPKEPYGFHDDYGFGQGYFNQNHYHY